MMERCLVTGGAGFIGSHLVEALIQQGYIVRVLDNFETGSQTTLSEWEKDIEIIEGSIEDFETVERAVDKMDWVFHQAARASVPRSIEDPFGTNSVNITGTLNVLIASRSAGVRRVVCASSSAIYGDSPEQPKMENMLPNPQSPYAISKLTLEHYSSVFFHLYGLQTVSLRYFNIYGPRQNPALQYAAVVPIFISNMLKNKACVIHGDGEQTRDFLFVQDCVRANLLAATSDRSPGNVYNIGCGNRTSVNELFQAIQQLIGNHIPSIHEPARKGDVLHSSSNIMRANEDLNFQPKFSLESGLKLTLDWYRTKAVS